MKKSILSLSAAVALGGLGYVGAANAVVALGVPGVTRPTADHVFSNPGGVGHALITPYYTAQGVMSTAFNITNTDTKNGKIVKVRFRGASNSDDVMDFTVFLSPGDVWTASINQNVNNGKAQIATDDKSCTFPSQTSDMWPADFSTDRLSVQLSGAQQAALTREGYIEVLNMANIPATIAGTKDGYGNPLVNPLFVATKHVGGVAPCTSSAIAGLMASATANIVTTASGALAAGLDSPTGGLMGAWGVFNTQQLAVYGGAQSAILATAEPVLGHNGSANAAPALINFAPQTKTPLDAVFPSGMSVSDYTNDVLLLAGSSGFGPIAPGMVGIRPVMYDLPDLSTPMVAADLHNPTNQAAKLAIAFEKEMVLNDYVAAAADASTVSWMTDWVVAQPTRRYHAAVLYDVINPGANILSLLVDGAFLLNADSSSMGDPYAPYTQQLRLRHTAYGPMACMDGSFSAFDREERTYMGQDFSPGTIGQYCGEVFTLQFGKSSVLQAGLTANDVSGILPGPAGWARLALGTPNPNVSPRPSQHSGWQTAIPAIGFAATSIKAGNGNYGLTIPHRWTGPGRTWAGNTE